jgi:uncharacterized membrane protein
MSDATNAPDQEIVVRIAVLLRLGVIAAAGVLLVGGVVFLMRHGGEGVPDRRTFERQPEKYAQPVPMFEEALEGSGRAIIQLGLLLLIATPVLRVGYSVIAFARRRDVVYIVVSLFVLIVLLVGFVFAPAGR